MLLRNHPLFSYRGASSWPPVWKFTGGRKSKQPRRKEIGILKEVTISEIQPADRCFLHMEHKGSTYVGCLLIEDQGFCGQIVTLLQGYLNRPIPEIGSLEVSYTYKGHRRSRRGAVFPNFADRSHPTLITDSVRGTTMDDKRCPVFVDGKECGLPIILVDCEAGKIARYDLGTYQCGLGHRSYVLLEPKRTRGLTGEE